MCQYDTFCLKIAWTCKIYIFSGVVWGIVVKCGVMVNGGGVGDKGAEGVGEGGICGLRGMGKVWERWGNVGMCGVWGVWGGCVILYILLYIIILL